MGKSVRKVSRGWGVGKLRRKGKQAIGTLTPMLRDSLLTSLTFLLLKKGNQAVGALALEGKQGNIFTFKKK